MFVCVLNMNAIHSDQDSFGFLAISLIGQGWFSSEPKELLLNSAWNLTGRGDIGEGGVDRGEERKGTEGEVE